MTDERRLEIAISRAKKLVNGDLYTARSRNPYCILCRHRIEKGKKYYRAGDLVSHRHCADQLSSSDNNGTR